MNKTIPELVFDQVQLQPERPIIRFRDLANPSAEDVQLSYGQLWRRACAVAASLESLRPAGHTMIVMALGADLLAAHLGAMLRGSAASIFTHPSEKIAPEVYERNLRHAISTLRPDAIVTARRFFASVTAALSDSACKVVVAEDIAGSASEESRQWQSASPGATAVIQYSSGSTGLQKCVALSHEMVIGQCESYGRFIGLDRDHDRVCSWLPLYHDMGLFTSWLIPVIHGVPIAMIDPFEWVRKPASLLRLITDVRGTLTWQPNFAFRLLASRLAGDERERLDLSSMRGFTNCSEPVRAGVMRDFALALRDVGLRESALWTCYAMAENAFAVTHGGGPSEPAKTIMVDADSLARGEARTAPDGALELASCGVPIESCEVRVVDELRATVAEGTVGEIALRSPFMLNEYIRAPDITSQVIDAARWYYSGDLGFQLDGRLYVTGRKKDLLIVAGRNFYPQDIEEIASQCEGAVPGRAVALGVEDAALGTQRIVVLVESRLADKADRARIAQQARKEILERLDCPVAEIGVVPHMWLLKTSSGKVARRPNLEKYQREYGGQPKAAPQPRPTSVDIPRRAGFGETAAWAFATALISYLYVLIFVLGDSKSWNIYAGF